MTGPTLAPFSLTSIFTRFPILIAAFGSIGSAQQYAGESFDNDFPAVAGSEIAFFNIKDTGNSGKNATFLNYYSLNTDNEQIDPTVVQRAYVVIHGTLRDPETYISNALAALAAVPDSSINRDNVALLSVDFANEDDEGTAFPWDDGPTSSALVWQDDEWIDSADAIYPEGLNGISSYDVLDQIVQYFDDKSIFPNMKQIIVGGHSGGAQITQRYAAVGNVLDTISPVAYYVANPDSFLWFTDDRPLDTGPCPSYDDWRFGLSNYPYRYAADIIAEGGDAVLERYNTRKINYARGLNDFGSESPNCDSESTGQDRGERLFNFFNAFTPSCPSPGPSCNTLDLIYGIGHNSGGMMASAAGVQRLFIDNFDGDGDTAYDFGYPRIQPGDDPFPDPKYAPGDPVYPAYSGLTFQGCYTDDASLRVLPAEPYAKSSNTPALCAATCVAAGYTIAGVEYANECHCGNALGSNSFKTANGGCHMACAGNSSQICGGSQRLSIWSKSSLV